MCSRSLRNSGLPKASIGRSIIRRISVGVPLNEKLEAIAKAQFRGVEIFENDLLS